MNNLDFSFEESPWERFAKTLENNSTISAAQLLMLLEEESEEAVEDAFLTLEEYCVTLDISDLPKPTVSGDMAVRLRQEQQLAAKGLRPDALEQGDPLRLYLEELAAIPACGDIRQLCEAWVHDRKETALNSLVNLSLSRVVELAQEYTGWGVLLLDLIQEGSLGLWQGTMGYTFGDYERIRDWWIRQYMAKAVALQARQSGVGQKLRTALEDYRNVDEQLLSDLGRNPTIDEIAEAMHTTPEAAATIGKMLENARRLQQARHTPEPEEEEQEEEQAVEDTAYFQTRQRVNEMLSSLTETEAKVISLLFGLEGGLPLSPEDTGRKLGLTPEEVVAVETSAMRKMRNQ